MIFNDPLADSCLVPVAMKKLNTFLLLLFCPFYVSAHHKFKCGYGKRCYTSNEICVQGNCVPKCDSNNDCEEGEYCYEKYKVHKTDYFFLIE